MAALVRWGSDRSRQRLVRLPCRTALFPLVVGELFDLGTVLAHDKNFAIRLRRAYQKSLIFESHARTCEQQAFSIRRLGQMRLVAFGMRQLGHACSVRMDSEYLEITAGSANECDRIPTWRPDRKVVPLTCEHLD